MMEYMESSLVVLTSCFTVDWVVPNYLVSQFQNESKRTTFYTKLSLICMKRNLSAEHIFIWIVSHKDLVGLILTPFYHSQLGNGLFLCNRQQSKAECHIFKAGETWFVRDQAELSRNLEVSVLRNNHYHNRDHNQNRDHNHDHNYYHNHNIIMIIIIIVIMIIIMIIIIIIIIIM